MIDIDALSQHGLSNKILKRIMTAEPPKEPRKIKRDKATRERRAENSDDPVGGINSLEQLPEDPTDWDIRCHLETVIRGEILEGITRCAENFDRVGAMDLAYASIPIHPTTLPLMRVALGHIKFDACQANIAKLSPETRDSIFKRDAKGNITGASRPKLLEVSHNLVHSLVTRRVAALATEVYQQFPVMKYEPYSNNQTGRLVGDAMTQIAEQMAGAYGYRKDYEESIRQASLYTDSIKFKKKAWHTEHQLLPKPPEPNGAKKTGRPAKKEFERRIVREGVWFTIPHPTRRYYDISEPLSKLNQDLGPRWIGHWEVVPVGTIKHDKAYWNRDKIVMDAELYSIFEQNPSYFSQYYDRINVPNRVTTAAALAMKNDRQAQIGAWSNLNDENATILSQHYKRVIPKDIGIGNYEDPVWIRFVMVGHTTCIFAEICGSCPGSVNQYNASDALLNSPSFGMQAIQWQEMLTNQLNELRFVQAEGLVKIYALNKHGMKKNEVEAVVNALKDPDFETLQPIVVEYDAEKLAQRGADIRTITEKITQIRLETASKVTEIFNGMMNTLALAERIMFFSPQELGQVSARTTSATEQKAIQNTTLGIRDFHLIGVKQQIDADKRIIHDSYMAFGSEDLEVPVAERYERAVIEAAGFTIVDDGSGNPPDGLFTIRGKKLGLFYNYTYTTRNTDDTPPDAAVAQGIAQVYDVATKSPMIADNLTLEQTFELANSLFEKLAPGIFKLRVPPGVDGKKTRGAQVEQLQAQLGQVLPQIGQAIQELQKKQAAQEQATAALGQSLESIAKTLSSFLPKTPAVDPNAPTKQGQIAPSFPRGNGAPPLRGVRPSMVVPALT